MKVLVQVIFRKLFFWGLGMSFGDFEVRWIFEMSFLCEFPNWTNVSLPEGTPCAFCRGCFTQEGLVNGSIEDSEWRISHMGFTRRV